MSTNQSERVAVLFADLVGSVNLYRRLGNDAAHGMIAESLDEMTQIVQEHRGTVIKTIGDCVMASLPTADLAAASSIEIHRMARSLSSKHSVALRFRIGFCFGPVIERDADLFGDAVNIAARLSAISRRDQILTTADVATLFSSTYRSMAKEYDHADIKGVDQTVTVVKLDWETVGVTEVFGLGPAPTEAPEEQAPVLELSVGGETLQLTPDDLPITVGREDGCVLVVRSARASRQHAQIDFHRGKFVWVDDSSNGSYLRQGSSDIASLFFRRETFPLVGEGWISLGVDDLDSNAVHYRVEGS
ncbi:MAG: adenylate/guanylate cyclase domain-containing protein [Panacagrimonas sp.]